MPRRSRPRWFTDNEQRLKLIDWYFSSRQGLFDPKHVDLCRTCMWRCVRCHESWECDMTRVFAQYFGCDDAISTLRRCVYSKKLGNLDPSFQVSNGISPPKTKKLVIRDPTLIFGRNGTRSRSAFHPTRPRRSNPSFVSKC